MINITIESIVYYNNHDKVVTSEQGCLVTHSWRTIVRIMMFTKKNDSKKWEDK